MPVGEWQVGKPVVAKVKKFLFWGVVRLGRVLATILQVRLRNEMAGVVDRHRLRYGSCSCGDSQP